MLWIFLAAAAAPLQSARNAMQRGMIGDAGPWGATLVRFLFGLPFSLLIFGVVAMLTKGAQPHASWAYAEAIVLGAAAQVGATAALLVAMKRSGFAVATVLQQSSLVFAALFGWVVGDHLPGPVWGGIVLTTAGVFVLSWPGRTQLKGAAVGSLLGLASGATFAVSLNAYRIASLTLDPHHILWSATASVCVAQALQSVVMLAALAVWRPGSLVAVAKSWRPSLGAGFFGAAASACWFASLGLAPAGPVRAIGVLEMTVAALLGRRLFKERMTGRQLVGSGLAAIGVILIAVG